MVFRIFFGCLLAVGACVWGLGLSRAAEPVDVALVLAVDVSSSINTEERQLQREGYAEALTSPLVLDAIRMGPSRTIAVTLFEWGSGGEARVVVPWTRIAGAASAAPVAAMIRGEKSGSFSGTSIAAALVYAEALLASSPPALRRVVDVSGDGRDDGAESYLAAVRRRLEAAGVTINGLPIIAPEEPTIAEFYAEHVVAGEGAFMIPAAGFSDFARAVRIKLITEIAGRTPVVQFAQAGGE